MQDIFRVAPLTRSFDFSQETTKDPEVELPEFGNSSLSGYESSQNTCLIVFRCNQRGADGT